MSQQRDLDQVLSDWLADESPRDTSARVTRAATSEAQRTRRLRPLPNLIASLKGDPMETTWRLRGVPSARPSLAMVIALLALAIAAGGLVVGSRVNLPDLFPRHAAVLLASPPPVGGGLVAFDSDGDIQLATADGVTVVQVTSDPAREVAPSWAPDGRRVAYWSFTGDTTATLVVRDLVDGSTVDIAKVEQPFLSDPGGGPAWSPDGTLVAWASGPQSSATIGVAKADGSAPPVPFAFPNHGVYDPLFSPDGALLSFAAWQAGKLIDLYVGDIAADGTLTDRRQVSHDSLVYPDAGDTINWTGGASFARSDWSPDGTWILTSADTIASNGASLLVAPDGTRQAVAAEGQHDLSWGAWSPDGTRIAYLRSVAGDPERDQLVMGAFDVTEQWTVKDIPMVNSLPAWSPDGTLVAVRSALGEGVVIVRTDGSDASVTIPATDATGDPVFQPVPVAVPGV